ncbi:MAG: type IV secretion system protein [Prosthecochloris sp.]|nr:type IV secretion system protein [Prosthecochloris sp.]
MNVRRLSGCVALVLSVLLMSETGRGPRVALGAWPVIDVANLNRNTVTSVQMVQDVIHQVTQIENQIRQYEAQLRMLRRLDGSSFSEVSRILDANMRDLSSVLREMNGIGYDLGEIEHELDTLFPQGDEWAAVELEEYDDYYRKWNRELGESARTAMRAQAVIERTQEYTEEASEILSRSAAAEGHVEQLQAQNQMLGVVSGQIGDLTRTIAASERVAATAAAVSAKEREAEMRLHKKMISDYANVDIAPEPLYRELPKLKK